MKRDEINEQLNRLAFEFFYKFTRFEFSLKVNKYLRNLRPGAPALPGWHEFAAEWQEAYRVTPEAQELIRAAPMYQVVNTNHDLQWREVDLNRCLGELGKVVRLAQTVRNNLFHGGKHDAGGWDDPERTAMLLNLTMTVLDQIADQTRLNADYLCRY